MSVTVRVPTTLRTLTGGASEVAVEGATVGEVFTSLESAHPGFAERLLDDEGGLRRFVNVFVADDDVRFLEGLDTAGARRRDRQHHPRRRRRLTARPGSRRRRCRSACRSSSRSGPSGGSGSRSSRDWYASRTLAITSVSCMSASGDDEQVEAAQEGAEHGGVGAQGGQQALAEHRAHELALHLLGV